MSVAIKGRTASLTAAQKARFKRDGWIVLKNLVPAALLAPANEEIDRRLKTGRHPGRDEYADPTDYISCYLDLPAIMGLARGAVTDVAESLIGAGRLLGLSEGQLVLRLPASDPSVLPLRNVHIDGFNSRKDGLFSAARRPDRPVRYSLAAGVVLSDTPKPDMGNLVVYPGSHRLIAEAISRGGLNALRDGPEKSLALPEPEQVLARAGDVVLFHYQLAHDKAINRSRRVRRTVYFRFWHLDAWHDRSLEYLEKAMSDPWLEWAGLR